MKPAIEGDVQDPPRAARDHRRQEEPRQRGHGDDVDRDEVHEVGEGRVGERSLAGGAGVVDEEPDLDSGPAKRIGQRLGRAGEAEIDRRRLDADAIFGRKLAPERVEHGFAARGEHEIGAARGERPGNLPADSRRRAGDERKAGPCAVAFRCGQGSLLQGGRTAALA